MGPNARAELESFTGVSELALPMADPNSFPGTPKSNSVSTEPGVALEHCWVWFPRKHQG